MPSEDIIERQRVWSLKSLTFCALFLPFGKVGLKVSASAQSGEGW